MVWRVRLVGAVFIAAACGGESFEEPPGGGAGDAGQAGEAGAADGASDSATGTGGNVGAAATGGSMMDSTGGGILLPPPDATGGTDTTGTGGALPPTPIAGDGGGTQDGGGQDPGDGAGGDDDHPGSASGGAPVTEPDPAAGGADVGAPRPPENCTLIGYTLTADVTPTDQCSAQHRCEDGREFQVACDGENDGTNTSLCDCTAGDTHWSAGGIIPGEAPESCTRGALACLNSWRAR